MVTPACFSELKFEKCGNRCECTPIQGNCKILKMLDYVVARNSTSIAHNVDIYPVHNTDAVGENMHYRLVISTFSNTVKVWLWYTKICTVENTLGEDGGLGVF